MFPANEGPTCLGLEVAEAVTGPPVRMRLAASSLKVVLCSLLVQTNTSSVNSTSAGWTSHMMAARASIWLLTSSAAVIAAMPVEKAIRLPPVAPVPADGIGVGDSRDHFLGSETQHFGGLHCHCGAGAADVQPIR